MNKECKILLVDDSEWELFLHREVLLLNGVVCEIETYNNVSEALDYLHVQDQSMVMHFVLSDLNMPVLTGIDFLNRLCHLPPHVQEKIMFYLLSSSTDISEMGKAKSNGRLVDILPKPLDVLQFIKSVGPHYKMTSSSVLSVMKNR